ncbi:MAG TPA: twin-arginine translocation signal domain-containing protein [Candidatus Acidoferrales bacterium]|nr:twin-arginine translocation signal domain-containing protein [Candidatus Acidoferrales bacterium]
MGLFDWAGKLSRRGFLAGGAATIAAVAVTGTTILADPKNAAAADTTGLTAEESRALLRFTRDLFPHDRLDDSFYAKAIAPLQDEAAKDSAIRKLLADGIAQLNASTMASAGMAYADASAENVRVAAIKQIEGGAFFTKVYGDTITPLYNQPELWPKFGYEGASSAQGGYLHRGFNDLDWL